MSKLCLDLGTKLGYAVVKAGQVAESGRVRLNSNSKSGERFIQFFRWLEDMRRTHDVRQCYYELVRRHIGTDAAHCYGAFQGLLLAWSCDHGLPTPIGISVASIKKSATGKGNAKKPEMIQAVKDLGYDPIDDNEADALALALHILKSGE